MHDLFIVIVVFVFVIVQDPRDDLLIRIMHYYLFIVIIVFVFVIVHDPRDDCRLLVLVFVVVEYLLRDQLIVPVYSQYANYLEITLRTGYELIAKTSEGPSNGFRVA